MSLRCRSAPLPCQPCPAQAAPAGTLRQLPGGNGCLVDRSATRGGCTAARALQGPTSFTGPGCFVAVPYPTCRTGRALRQANAVAVSPDGRNVYVGAFSSDSLAVFRRTS